MKVSKKKIAGVVFLVAVCAVGVARLFGYDVTPLCSAIPSLCTGEMPKVEFPEELQDAGAGDS